MNESKLPLSELIERARNFSVHTSAEEAIYVCRRLADALESQTEQPECATEDDDAKIARLSAWGDSSRLWLPACSRY